MSFKSVQHNISEFDSYPMKTIQFYVNGLSDSCAQTSVKVGHEFAGLVV